MAASMEVDGPAEGIIDRRAFNGLAKDGEAEEAVALSEDDPAVLAVPLASVAEDEAAGGAEDVCRCPVGCLVCRVAEVLSTALMSRASKLLMIESLSPASVQKVRKREMIWL